MVEYVVDRMCKATRLAVLAIAVALVLVLGFVAGSTASAADVLGCSPSTNALTTDTRPWLLRSDRAPRSAAAFIFLGVRWT